MFYMKLFSGIPTHNVPKFVCIWHLSAIRYIDKNVE